MSRIANTEVILPKSLSAEARSQLIDALYAVHGQIFEGVERESFAWYVVESQAEHTWIQLQMRPGRWPSASCAPVDAALALAKAA